MQMMMMMMISTDTDVLIVEGVKHGNAVFTPGHMSPGNMYPGRATCIRIQIMSTDTCRRIQVARPGYM